MADNHFPKSFRLLSAEDFSYLKSSSLHVRDKWLRAYFKLSRLNLVETRLGLSVSKKVGNAVLRNRTKRILREAFRKSEFKNLSLDLLLIVSPHLYKEMSRTEAEAELSKSFDRVFRKLLTVK